MLVRLGIAAKPPAQVESFTSDSADTLTLGAVREALIISGESIPCYLCSVYGTGSLLKRPEVDRVLGR